MNSEPAIRVRGLGKRYESFDNPRDRLLSLLLGGARRSREFWALRGVGFEVKRGEAVGVLGRNGSGKSTLLQLVCGARAPSEGTVRVNGRVNAVLGLGGEFDPERTGRENALLAAAARGLSGTQARERLESIFDFADIGDFLDRPVREYSAGMAVRLAFAAAFSLEPDVLVVDEALAVGDEAFQRKCFARLEAFRAGGGTLLFVTQWSHLVSQLCDRALLLDGGELLLAGPPRVVVPRYHQLITAPARRVAEVRAEIRDRAGSAAEPPYLDTGLEGASASAQEPRGARIEDARVETPSGERVNVLAAGQEYVFAFSARFERAAARVRCSALVSAATGLALAVCPGREALVASVTAGTVLRARLRFRCHLGAGVYFLNAAVLGDDGDGEAALHRVVDAAVFRVAPGPAGGPSGLADLQFRAEVAASCSEGEEYA